MKKILFSISMLLVLSSFSYADEKIDLKQNIQSIEQEYQELLIKEKEKLEEFRVQKAQLEEKLSTLREQFISKDKIIKKLEKDSQIRWHRDKYKKLLKNYKKYYEKLEVKIADTEQQIVELTKLIQVMQ